MPVGCSVSLRTGWSSQSCSCHFHNLKDAMKEDKAEQADQKEVNDQVKEIHDSVKQDAADLKAARKETITAEHANMTDEDYIKNLPEHHMPSWIASYNKNKTEEAEKAQAAAAKAAEAEAKKKTEDAENKEIANGADNKEAEAAKDKSEKKAAEVPEVMVDGSAPAEIAAVQVKKH